MLVLSILQPNAERRRVTVRHTPAHIGRTTGSIRLPDSRVSRLHAALRFGEAGWVVEDLGSRHGTYVNDRRIKAVTALAAGDVLRIGRIELAVEQIDAEQRPEGTQEMSRAPRLRLYARWRDAEGRPVRRVLSAHGPEPLGRDAPTLPIEARHVRGEHAWVRPTDQAWTIEPASPVAPVVVNGGSIALPTPLAEGDRVTIGRASILVLEATAVADAGADDTAADLVFEPDGASDASSTGLRLDDAIAAVVGGDEDPEADGPEAADPGTASTIETVTEPPERRPDAPTASTAPTSPAVPITDEAQTEVEIDDAAEPVAADEPASAAPPAVDRATAAIDELAALIGADETTAPAAAEPSPRPPKAEAAPPSADADSAGPPPADDDRSEPREAAQDRPSQPPPSPAPTDEKPRAASRQVAPASPSRPTTPVVGRPLKPPAPGVEDAVVQHLGMIFHPSRGPAKGSESGGETDDAVDAPGEDQPQPPKPSRGLIGRLVKRRK